MEIPIFNFVARHHRTDCNGIGHQHPKISLCVNKCGMRNAKAMKKIAKMGHIFFNCRTPLQTFR